MSVAGDGTWTMSMPIQVDTTMVMVVATGSGLPRPLENHPFPQYQSTLDSPFPPDPPIHTTPKKLPKNHEQ